MTTDVEAGQGRTAALSFPSQASASRMLLRYAAVRHAERSRVADEEGAALQQAPLGSAAAGAGRASTAAASGRAALD